VTSASFWLEEPRDELRAARFDGPAEVAVVGGGVTGCSAALTLAERGVRVRLHEAREIAAGASGRNGGFALRGATLPHGGRAFQERRGPAWRSSRLGRARSRPGSAGAPP